MENQNIFGIDDDSNDEDHHIQRQRRHPQACEGDVKIEVPKFDCKMLGYVFLDWLYTVERIFNFKKYSEERKLKLVAIKLKVYASLWWENLKKEGIKKGGNLFELGRRWNEN